MSALTKRILELLPDARLQREVADNGDREMMILGPPGTGKTRSLGVLLEAHLKAGLPPDQMLVNAFTRNATGELKRRLTGEYGLTDPEMAWVRTIHSSCFQLLRLRSEQVVNSTLLSKFGEDTGYKLAGALGKRNVEDPYAVGSVQTLGDWCYISEELRRVSLRSIDENWEMLQAKNPTGESWTRRDARDFSETYRRWKKDSGLYDFTDMLELVLREGLRPPVKWLFLDEVQDQTPLQWKVADLWLEEASRLMTFGDPDQCIFEWSGASSVEMTKRNAHRVILSHSYRLSSAIHAEAQGIIRRIKDRIALDFNPHAEGGEVTTSYDWMDVDVHKKEGSWLLLVRNRMYAANIRSALVESATPFYDRTSEAGIPAPGSPKGLALSVLLTLHDGGFVRGGKLRLLQRQVYADDWPIDKITYNQQYSLMDIVDAGAIEHLRAVIFKAPLKALRMESGDRAYLEAVLRRHGAGALLAKPTTELSTIHAAKGEEADNVAVSLSMTRRTRTEYEENPDSESRVYYVAATRARSTLTWVADGPGWELNA